MFGKPKAPGSDDTRPSHGAAARGESGPSAVPAQAPELTRRSGGYAPPGARRGDQRNPAPGIMGRPSGPERQLVVGREISLSGEIKACETLIVEGKVAADLKDCKALQIAVSGMYKGAAAVEQADISGHFDGDLTVTGTLILRSTGRVSGVLRYREMEIERGGKLRGTLEDIPPARQPAETRPAPGQAPARATTPTAKKPAPEASAATAAPKATEADDLVTRAQSGGAPAT